MADLSTADTAKPIIVRAPRDLQVVQRDATGWASVLISGRIQSREKVAGIRARVLGTAAGGPLDQAWFDVPLARASGTFNLHRSLPGGGWYTLEVQAVAADGGALYTDHVRLGVGEVFVGAGQSNSTNSGQFPIKQSSGLVSSFSGSAWQIADDPQPGVHDNSQGGSYWPAFGDTLAATLQVPIGVASTGHGGTSVDHWHPGDELFAWMMTRIYQLGPGGFRAVLWHQGESDVQMPSTEYVDKLQAIIRTSTLQAGWEFPWFVAQVSYHSPEAPRFESTRNAHETLWRKGIAVQGPDTDVLDGDHRDMDGLGIHFSPKGLKAHGEMWAAHVAEYLAGLRGETA